MGIKLSQRPKQTELMPDRGRKEDWMMAHTGLLNIRFIKLGILELQVTSLPQICAHYTNISTQGACAGCVSLVVGRQGKIEGSDVNKYK